MMKKSILSLLIAVVVLFSFSACSSNQDETTINTSSGFNPFESMDEQNSGNSITNAEFAFGTSVQELKYTGTDLEFEYEIENGSVECEVGIMVVIDGIPQKYRTDTDNSEQYVHSYKLSKDTTEIFKIYVNPSVGKSGETLLLNTLSILNPSFSPDPQAIEYANNLKINESGYIPVHFMQDASEDILQGEEATTVSEIPENIVKEIEMAGGDIKSGVDPYLYFDSLNSDDTRKIKLDNNSKLKMTLNGFGGTSNKYRIFIFDNNTVIPFSDGTSYIEMQYIPDKLTSISIEIDNNKLLKNSSLYAIAFPVVENTNIASTSTIHPVQTPIYFVEQ